MSKADKEEKEKVRNKMDIISWIQSQLQSIQKTTDQRIVLMETIFLNLIVRIFLMLYIMSLMS